MKLWRGGSDQYELPEKEIAKQFLASEWASRNQRIHLSLRTFIARDLRSTWDDDAAFERIQQLILATQRHPGRS